MARSLRSAFALRIPYSVSSFTARSAPTVSSVKRRVAPGSASSRRSAKSARMVSSTTTDGAALPASTAASACRSASCGPSASAQGKNGRSVLARTLSTFSAGIRKQAWSRPNSSITGRSSPCGDTPVRYAMCDVGPSATRSVPVSDMRARRRAKRSAVDMAISCWCAEGCFASGGPAISAVAIVSSSHPPSRHPRAWPGDPRLCRGPPKSWVAGPSV